MRLYQIEEKYWTWSTHFRIKAKDDDEYGNSELYQVVTAPPDNNNNEASSSSIFSFFSSFSLFSSLWCNNLSFRNSETGEEVLRIEQDILQELPTYHLIKSSSANNTKKKRQQQQQEDDDDDEEEDLNSFLFDEEDQHGEHTRHYATLVKESKQSFQANFSLHIHDHRSQMEKHYYIQGSPNILDRQFVFFRGSGNRDSFSSQSSSAAAPKRRNSKNAVAIVSKKQLSYIKDNYTVQIREDVENDEVSILAACIIIDQIQNE